jgi:hypothetical protein
MKRFLLYTLFLLLAVSGFYFAAVCRVQATIGGSADSVDSDMKALSARRLAMTRHTNYTVHELDYDSSKVREYVSTSGTVFGIAWNGPARPDLTKLLGSYAEEYKEASAQKPRRHGRRPSQVNTGSIIVQQWGHMRNLQGRAYVPALMPPGVNADEIK